MTFKSSYYRTRFKKISLQQCKPLLSINNEDIQNIFQVLYHATTTKTGRVSCQSELSSTTFNKTPYTVPLEHWIGLAIEFRSDCNFLWVPWGEGGFGEGQD